MGGTLENASRFTGVENFRRVASDSLGEPVAAPVGAILGSPLSGAEGSLNGREFPFNHEVTTRWGLHKIDRPDIAKIYPWFLDEGTKLHIYDPKISPYVPTNPTSQAQAEKFMGKLSEYYIKGRNPFLTDVIVPQGGSMNDFMGEISEEVGKKREQILVSRITNVATTATPDRNSTPIGVQSWLTGDPFAPQEDREKIDAGELKVAYGHVLIVDPRLRHKGIGGGKYLTLARNEELLGTPDDPGEYDQISGWVSLAGHDWGGIVNHFRSAGYSLDRRPEAQAVVVSQGGQLTEMWRILITQNDWWRIREQKIAELKQILNG